MNDGQENDVLERGLREALAQNGPLLATAPIERMRRQAATEILQAVKLFLQGWDRLANNSSTDLPKTVLREGFSLLLAHFGPGDAQVRESVLPVLKSLRQQESRQILLDFLPSTMPMGEDEDLEEVTVEVIDTLRAVLLCDPRALLPVLGCLSILPVAESGRSESFQVAVTALPMVSETELPTLVRTLVRHVATEEEAAQAWAALRDELQLLEQSSEQQQSLDEASNTNDGDAAAGDDDPLSLIAHVVLTSFSDPTNGSRLKQSYVKTLETNSSGTESSISDGCLLLDLVVLLTLSQHVDSCDAAERILDSWLATGRFPFEALETLLRMVCGNKKYGQPTCLLYRRLAPSLLRLSIFLLLAPARGSLALESTPESIHSFILSLHHRLDRELQAELVQSLLHLGEEAATGWERMVPKRGRKRTQRATHSDGDDFARVIHQSVHRILQALAEREPRSLVRFKHILTGRLTSTSYSQNGVDGESTRELCAILSRLVESDRVHNGGGLDSSEVMMLVQKLLFSSSGAFGRAAGDSTRIVRGLMLATELIRLASLNDGDRDCIKQWVLRILLPSTRRMVDPELGSPGLAFLEAWTSGGDASSSKDVFQNFKMILANTGLIQMLAHYQQTKKKDSVVLGYTKIPDQFLARGNVAKGKQQREMVFCVNYFLRQNDMHCPSRWKHSTMWVFELVDTYLKMGREKATNGWVPHGWLQAAVEFPSLSISLEPSTKKQEVALEWIKSSLSHFVLSANDTTEPEGLQTNMCELIAQSHGRKALKQLRDSLFRFALAFLIGIGLSGSVLKNAFEHYKTLSTGTDPDEELVPLIHIQILKVYDLRTKLRIVDCLLSYLKDALVRQQRRTKLNSDARSKGAHETVGSLRTEKAGYNDNSVEPVMPRDESMLEEARMLTEVDFSLSQIQSIDATLFSTSDFFFDCEVLWVCLADSKHDLVIRRSLDSLPCERSSLGPQDHTAASRLIDYNTQLVDHLVSLATGPSGILPLPNKSMNQRAQILHCIRTSFFFIDALPDLRKHQATSRSDQEKKFVGVEFPLVVRLATSYLQLLIAVMTKLAESRSSESIAGTEGVVLTYRDFMELFRSVLERGLSSDVDIEVRSIVSADDSNSSLVEVICDKVLERLGTTDDALVANQLLEILSILALNDKSRFTERLNQASWSCLHTIYAKVTAGRFDSELAYAFRLQTHRFRSQAASKELQSLQRALDATILKSANDAAIAGLDFMLFRHGLMRHWGLLTHSTLTLSQLESHLSHLVSELSSFLGNLESTVDDNHEDEKKDTDDLQLVKKARPGLSSIPWLTAATFVDFFELLLHMIVGATAVVPPATKMASETEECGSYYHLDNMAHLFCRLLDIYQKRILVFPRRATSKVSHACRHMLSVSVCQLHRCVDWRNSQPLLSREQREANTYDAGAMKHFQKLLDSVAANTAGRVLSLCEFWQSKERASQYVSKSTALSYAAEKAARTMKTVASAHNLTPPVFDLGDEEEEEGEKGLPRSDTQGFHQMDGTAVRNKRRRIAPELLRQAEDVDVSRAPSEQRRLEEEQDDADVWDAESSDLDGASSGSFGVAGDWGEESDDDSAGMLNLQSTLPLLRE